MTQSRYNIELHTVNTHIITHRNCTTAQQSGKQSELKSSKIYDSTSDSEQRMTSKMLLQNSLMLIQKAAWSATPDDKHQTKYLEYPQEVKDQNKEERKLR
jgi:hypothetical protein